MGYRLLLAFVILVRCFPRSGVTAQTCEFVSGSCDSVQGDNRISCSGSSSDISDFIDILVEKNCSEKVSEIDLGDKYTEIPTYVTKFVKLKSLYLSGNEIQDIKYPINSSSLEQILLSSNLIQEIHRDAFVNCSGLKLLSLQQNQLQRWNCSCIPLQLETLILSKNDFSLKGSFTFDYRCKNIVDLRIAESEISIIHDNAFIGLEKLKKLDLSKNVIKLFSSTAFAVGLPTKIELTEKFVNCTCELKWLEDYVLNDSKTLRCDELSFIEVMSTCTEYPSTQTISVDYLENNNASTITQGTKTVNPISTFLSTTLSPSSKVTTRLKPFTSSKFATIPVFKDKTTTKKPNDEWDEDDDETDMEIPLITKRPIEVTLSTRKLTDVTSIEITESEDHTLLEDLNRDTTVCIRKIENCESYYLADKLKFKCVNQLDKISEYLKDLLDIKCYPDIIKIDNGSENDLKRTLNAPGLSKVKELHFINTPCHNVFAHKLQSMIYLQTLHLENCVVGKVSEDAFADLVNLTLLELSNLQIVEFPYAVNGLKQLISLYLRRNNISAIDDVIDLPKVIQIYLDDNKIERFGPECFAKCKNLKTLHMPKNKISQLNRSFCPKNIVDLNLDDNDISSENIILNGGCNSLLKLSLARNKITEFNSLLCTEAMKTLVLSGNHFSNNRILFNEECENLMQVTLPNTQLKHINKAFFNIKGLLKLDLSNNQLETVKRTDFDNLPSDFEIQLRGNKLICDCELMWIEPFLTKVELDQITCKGDKKIADVLQECKYPIETTTLEHQNNNITTTTEKGTSEKDFADTTIFPETYTSPESSTITTNTETKEFSESQDDESTTSNSPEIDTSSGTILNTETSKSSDVSVEDGSSTTETTEETTEPISTTNMVEFTTKTITDNEKSTGKSAMTTIATWSTTPTVDLHTNAEITTNISEITFQTSKPDYPSTESLIATSFMTTGILKTTTEETSSNTSETKSTITENIVDFNSVEPNSNSSRNSTKPTPDVEHFTEFSSNTADTTTVTNEVPRTNTQEEALKFLEQENYQIIETNGMTIKWNSTLLRSAGFKDVVIHYQDESMNTTMKKEVNISDEHYSMGQTEYMACFTLPEAKRFVHIDRCIFRKTDTNNYLIPVAIFIVVGFLAVAIFIFLILGYLVKSYQVNRSKPIIPRRESWTLYTKSDLPRYLENVGPRSSISSSYINYYLDEIGPNAATRCRSVPYKRKLVASISNRSLSCSDRGRSSSCGYLSLIPSSASHVTEFRQCNGDYESDTESAIVNSAFAVADDHTQETSGDVNSNNSAIDLGDYYLRDSSPTFEHIVKSEYNLFKSLDLSKRAKTSTKSSVQDNTINYEELVNHM